MDDSKSPPNQKLYFLDGLRGFAAVYVMIGHARWLLWEGYSSGFAIHPDTYAWHQKLIMYFLSLFRFGHEFVIFFFLLSGFVIHLKYANQFKKNSHSLFGYRYFFIKRAKRIYPPFVFALLLTLLLDVLGRSFHLSIYAGTTPYALINEKIGNAQYGLRAFAGNLLFLYSEYAPLFGTNNPAWSLKYEWWFYMLYPCFMLFSKKHIYFSTALIIALFITSIIVPVWPEPLLQHIFSMMLYWWAGVLLAEIYTRRIQVSMLLFALFCLAGFGLLYGMSVNTLYDLQITLLFASIVGGLLWCADNNKSLFLLNRLKPFGDFSYTLYIIHFPILVFLSGWILRYNNNQLPAHFLFVAAGCILCLLIAYVSHFITERLFTHRLSEKA